MDVGIPTPITNHQIGSQALGSYNLCIKAMTTVGWWWDGWEIHHVKSGARFWGIQKQFLIGVSWMKFVFFEFRFSFLSRVPPILGSMPSNVLMFGYHQVYITHIKKAYLQGTVLLHFKHLFKVCIPERESSVCWFKEFSSSVHNFGVISASPPANKCRTAGKCNLKTSDWKWWPFWQHFAKEGCFSPNKTAGLDNHPVLTCWAFQAYQILHELFVSPNGENPKFRRCISLPPLRCVHHYQSLFIVVLGVLVCVCWFFIW